MSVKGSRCEAAFFCWQRIVVYKKLLLSDKKIKAIKN